MNFYVKFLLLYLAVDWIIPKVLAGTETFAHRNMYPVTPFEFPGFPERTIGQIVSVLVVSYILARYVF